MHRHVAFLFLSKFHIFSLQISIIGLVEDKLLLSEEKNSFDITAWKKPLIPFVVLTYVPFLLHFLLQVGGLPSVVGNFFFNSLRTWVGSCNELFTLKLFL